MEEPFEINDPEILEDLLCPICLILPLGEIYLCKNGHTICAACCDKAQKCPLCQVTFQDGKTRNRPMENLIGSLKCPCPFQSVGCTQVLRRRDLAEHKSTCIYNGKCAQLCKLLGYECESWITTLNAEQTIKHLVTAHGIQNLESIHGRVQLEEILRSTDHSPKSYLWTPVILKRYYEDHPGKEVPIPKVHHVLVFNRFHQSDQTFSWTAILLEEPSETLENFGVQLCIPSGVDNNPPLKWRIPIVSVTRDEVLIREETTPFRIPAEILRRGYLNDEKCQVFLKIVETCQSIHEQETVTLVSPIALETKAGKTKTNSNVGHSAEEDATPNANSMPSLNSIFLFVILAVIISWLMQDDLYL